MRQFIQDLKDASILERVIYIALPSAVIMLLSGIVGAAYGMQNIPDDAPPPGSIPVSEVPR